MPAVFDDFMGAKLVTLYTENAGSVAFQHIRRALYCSVRKPANRWPFMDGRLITELRTAAVSAVATRLASQAGRTRSRHFRQWSPSPTPM